MALKNKPNKNTRMIDQSLISLFLIEKNKYTAGAIRFLTRYGMRSHYNVKLFSQLLEIPELGEYMSRYNIKNHKDLHKYVQRRLVEYVNNYIATGKR